MGSSVLPVSLRDVYKRQLLFWQYILCRWRRILRYTGAVSYTHLLIKRRTVANEVADAGRILINGKVAKASQAVNAGDIIEAVSYTHLDVYKRQLTTILCTHGHYDHVGSAAALKAEWNATLYCEKADLAGDRMYPCLLYTSRCV